MNTEQEIKDMVKAKYTAIANQETKDNLASCCGATGCSDEVYNIMTDSYKDMDGHVQDADLGLGCGLPTEFAKIQKGQTVIDLGSGAGNDCFIARHETGAEGKIIGIDFSEAMINKARTNAEKMGYNNVEFRSGDIEHMPVADNTADVIVSNCVLNLVPNKRGVVQDIHRVLKPGGHFSISDIVLVGDLTDSMRQQAEMYAGCVTGAIQKEEYMNIINEQGFKNVQIQKEKQIIIPDDILNKHLNADDATKFKSKEVGIYSVTVFAQKTGGVAAKEGIKTDSAAKEEACCGPDCC